MVDLAIRHRFTVDEVHRMGEAGILSEDDRVELIDGEIVEMPPIGSRHATCVRRLDRWLQKLVGDDAVVSAGGNWSSPAVTGGPVRAEDILGPG